MQLFLKPRKDSYKKKYPSIITFDPLVVCGGVCVYIDPNSISLSF